MNTIRVSNSHLVQFINRRYVVNFDNPGLIPVEWMVDSKVRVSCNDWVGLFPKGPSFSLDHMLTYEWVRLHGPADKNKRTYKIDFSLKGVKHLSCEQDYQFLYFNRNSEEVLGIGEPFRFTMSTPTVITPKIESFEINNNERADFKEVDGELLEDKKSICLNKKSNNLLLKSAIFEKNSAQTPVKGNNELNVDYRERNHGAKNKKFNKTHKIEMYGPVGDSCMVSGCQGLTSCPNCKRVGSLLKTQAELYTKIKNLAEMNRDLESQVTELQKQVELGQAAYQKLLVNLMHERDWNQFYQAAASDRVEYQCQQMVTLYQHTCVGFDCFQRPIYAILPVVQYTPLITHQVVVVDPNHSSVVKPAMEKRNEEKARLGSMMKLKAIIGSQEEKIRSLTEKLAELEIGKVQKVRAVLKEIEHGDMSSTFSDG